MAEKNEYQQRAEWLNGLKVGDRIVLSYTRGSNPQYYIRPVESISKTRTVIKVNGLEFNGLKDGSQRGEDYSAWSIYEPTPEMVAKALASRAARERGKLAAEVMATINNLDTETLLKIKALIDSGSVKP